MNQTSFAHLETRLKQKRVMFILIMAILLGSNITWVEQTHAEEKPSLAILPFVVEKGEDPGRSAVCPLCKGVYRSGEILSGSQNVLTRVLYQKMEAMGRFKILPLEKVEGAPPLQDVKTFKEQPIPLSIQVGKELSANFLFVGFIFRFEERIGSSVGVERPASVGLDVHLFRLRDSMGVWKGKWMRHRSPLARTFLRSALFSEEKPTG